MCNGFMNILRCNRYPSIICFCDVLTWRGELDIDVTKIILAYYHHFRGVLWSMSLSGDVGKFIG